MSMDATPTREDWIGRHGVRLLFAMGALAIAGAFAIGDGLDALWFALPYLAFYVGVRQFASVPRFQRIALNFALALSGFCTLAELIVFLVQGGAALQNPVLHAMYGLNLTVGLMLIAAALIWKLLRYAASDDDTPNAP
ncbi:MAG: hypothetical protein ABFC67_00200 [Mizugakiibacter sp.]|uniref:hypothetical protein n=1 Tax=Mizugakiibacter sp. TaxID=1972610 RepID=UPI0031C1AE6A|nr:hypothetical protein [Xanthomonadaceae bacterium]